MFKISNYFILTKYLASDTSIVSAVCMFMYSVLKIFTTRSELQKVLFLVPSVCGFLFVYEISLESLNGFAPNSHRDVFGPRSDEFEGQGHQGQKWQFSALSAACMRFMFRKTSLACSFNFNFLLGL